MSHIEGDGSDSLRLVGSFYVYYLEFFCVEDLPLPSHLFISVGSHKYVFFSLGYNPVVLFFILLLILFFF